MEKITISLDNKIMQVTPQEFDQLMHQIKKDNKVIMVAKISATNESHVSYNTFSPVIQIVVAGHTFRERLRWLFTGRFTNIPYV
jgi:hypothetical protein